MKHGLQATNKFIVWLTFQEKHVNIVAVGIGPGINKLVLQQIAGVGNPVVEVKDFSQLQNMIETIKASACSGRFNQCIVLYPLLENY